MTKISAFIGLGTGCFFILIGILIASRFTERLASAFKSPESAMLFGGAIALYGAFRVYRAYKWIKSA